MNIKVDNEKFLKGTVSVSIAVILTKIMGVLYKVPLSYVLGDEGMGYFNSAYALYSFFYILCASGVPKAITLTIIKHRQHGTSLELEVMKSGFKIFTAIGAAITLISIVFAPVLTNIIGSKGSFYTILAISPAILFVSIGGVLKGCLNTYNKLTEIAVSQLIEAFLKLLLGLAMGFIAYRMKLHITLISAMCVLGITLGSAISDLYLWVCYKSVFKNDISRQNMKPDKQDIARDMLKIAMPISFGAAVLNFGGIIDLWIIMRRLGDMGYPESERISIYGNYTTLAVPMFNLVVSLISPLMLAFLPHLADSFKRNDKQLLADTTSRMCTVCNLIAVPAFFSFYFYSFDILDILFSVNSSAFAAELLRALSFAVVLISLLTVVNTVLEAKGKIGVAVFSLIVGGVVKAVCNYILIARYGILGAPLSTLISYAVSLMISLVAIRIFGIKISLYKNCLPEIVVGFILFAIPYMSIYSVGKIKGELVSLALCISVSAVAYLFFLFSRVYICTAKEYKKCTKSKE